MSKLVDVAVIGVGNVGRNFCASESKGTRRG